MNDPTSKTLKEAAGARGSLDSTIEEFTKENQQASLRDAQRYSIRDSLDFVNGLANSTVLQQRHDHNLDQIAHSESGQSNVRVGDASALTCKEQLELYRRKEEVLKLELEVAKANLLLLQSKSQALSQPSTSTAHPYSNFGPNAAGMESFSAQHNIRELTSIAPTFDPGDKTGLSSSQWLRKIEELREVYELSDKTVLLLASSKLVNAAKFWLHASQSKITTWDSMKAELQTAFPSSVDEAEVHMTLSKRRKRSNETFEQYYFEVIAVANRIHMSDSAKLRYLINGLGNSDLRTVLSLQHFKTPEQLLRQYRSYEEMQNFNPPKVTQTPSIGNVDKQSDKKCYNCNELGHVSVHCPKPQRKPRCPICQKVGHTEKECKRSPTVSLIQQDEYYKVALINGVHKVSSFIDLGSDVSLIKESSATKLNLNYTPFKIALKGFGHGQCFTNGRANIELTVDTATARISIFIIPDIFLLTDVLVGRDFADQSHIVVVKKEGQLKISEALTSVVSETFSAGDYEEKENLSDHLVSSTPEVQERTNNDATSSHDHGINGEPVACNLLSLKRLDIRVNTLEPIRDEEVNCGEINDAQRQELLKVIRQYRKCFAKNIYELGCSKNTQFTIQLKQPEIVNCRPYRLSFPQQQKVDAILQELLQANMIQASNSEYSSPALLVKKKDGDDRLVIDYRKINDITVKDRHPLPVIEDLLQLLSGSLYFVVLDFASGYYQVPVAEESRKFTAFVTPHGEYEFLRMPFGLSNAPSQFQRMMNNLGRKMTKGKIIVYMDDVLLPCKSFDLGIEILTEFFSLLSEEGLTLKLKKSYFFMTKVEFLGYEITSEGTRPSTLKTAAVREMSRPQNQRDLRQFIGLTSYFRKFVPEYGIIARPLTDLLKKDKEFVWTETQEASFIKLKDILTSQPLLTLFNPNFEHEVHTDACASGLAGMLLQCDVDGQLRPVSYFSRRTTEQEKFYHSYELEVLAVVETLSRFRSFLLGKRFKVVTDCQAIKAAAKKKEMIPRIARWWLILSDFDFEVIYRKGNLIQHADCLSRQPHEEPREMEGAELKVFSLNISNEDWLLTIQRQDTKLTEIINILLRKPTCNEEKQVHKDYVFEKGRLFRNLDGKLKWVVPRNVIWRIIKTCHDDVGHPGVERTLQHLKRYYWFARMRNKTKNYISSCVNCAYYKKPAGKAEGELHCIEKVAIPFHTIHADHLGPFPKSTSGNTHILGLVDGFTKYTILHAVKNTSTRAVLKVLNAVSLNFGVPTRIITDRGTAFSSKEFEKYCEDNCIRHILTAARSPRGNGQIERCNRTILNALRTMADGEKTWDKLLRPIQWGLNSSQNGSTKRTPNELLFGFQPRDPLQNKVLLTLQDDDSTNQLDIVEIRERATENILAAQKAQKEYYDAKRKPARKYQERDLVLIERPAISTGDSRKLDPKFKGPYVVTEVLENDRYRIKDIPEAHRNQRPFESVYAADTMKPWCSNLCDDISEDSEGSEDESLIQEGRAVTSAPQNTSATAMKLPTT